MTSIKQLLEIQVNRLERRRKQRPEKNNDKENFICESVHEKYVFIGFDLSDLSRFREIKTNKNIFLHEKFCSYILLVFL
jgi:hypothetical protein